MRARARSEDDSVGANLGGPSPSGRSVGRGLGARGGARTTERARTARSSSPWSGLLLGTVLRWRRQRARTWCSTKASATVRATVGEVELCFSAIRRRAFSFSARRWRGRATARAASCVLDWSDGKGCRGSFIREWRRFPLYMIGSVDKICVISGGDRERRGREQGGNHARAGKASEYRTSVNDSHR